MWRSWWDIWGLSNAIICCHCLRNDVFQNVSHIFRDDRWNRTRADHGLHARANVNLKRLACAACRLKKGAPFRFSSNTLLCCHKIPQSFQQQRRGITDTLTIFFDLVCPWDNFLFLVFLRFDRCVEIFTWRNVVDSIISLFHPQRRTSKSKDSVGQESSQADKRANILVKSFWEES